MYMDANYLKPAGGSISRVCGNSKPNATISDLLVLDTKTSCHDMVDRPGLSLANNDHSLSTVIFGMTECIFDISGDSNIVKLCLVSNEFRR